jgi:hypothetical protein
MSCFEELSEGMEYSQETWTSLGWLKSKKN